MRTVGKALVDMLETLDVEVVFGIPGVHTVELYRGLARSGIRHITPRHEQGAGFMADGYARATGKPGVCLLITGPGLTNALTAMAQAMQDSIPMLVISGANPRDTLGKGLGHLHELPDQHGLLAKLTPHAYSVRDAEELPVALTKAFEIFASARPGPVHIEIPIDLMSETMPEYELAEPAAAPPQAADDDCRRFAELASSAKCPVILAGGGTARARSELIQFAETLDAPIITTANARSAMGDHPLHVPASGHLKSVRAAIANADLVIGVGTEMGPTDYDVYADGKFPNIARFLRIDIDAEQIGRGPEPILGMVAEAAAALRAIIAYLPNTPALKDGAGRAAEIVRAALNELTPEILADLDIIDCVIEALPGCTLVGDSTQLIYSGNTMHRAPVPSGWFNSATGFGTLGYGPPAAIGASIANPDAPVVCIVGDGGIQFTLAELGSARDANAPVIFLIWNNSGYREIEKFMIENQIEPVGVKPSPPDFESMAKAYGLAFARPESRDELAAELAKAWEQRQAAVIELRDPEVFPDCGYR